MVATYDVAEERAAVGQSAEIALDEIDIVAGQPRDQWDDAEDAELQASVREHGILQPVLVTPCQGRYRLVAGERRLRAALAVGLPSIPAQIRTLTDLEVAELQLVENLQRKKLNPMQEAAGFQHVRDRATEAGQEYTEQHIAQRIGRPLVFVQQRLALLTLVEPAQQAVRAGTLSVTNALMLARVAGAKQQQKLLEHAAVNSAENFAYHLQHQSRPLTDAPFNVKGCKECPHNGGRLKDIYGGGKPIDGACFDGACYARKVKEALDAELDKAAAAGRLVMNGAVTKSALDAGALQFERAAWDGPDPLDEALTAAKRKKCATCAERATGVGKINGKGTQNIVHVCLDAVVPVVDDTPGGKRVCAVSRRDGPPGCRLLEPLVAASADSDDGAAPASKPRQPMRPEEPEYHRDWRIRVCLSLVASRHTACVDRDATIIVGLVSTLCAFAGNPGCLLSVLRATGLVSAEAMVTWDTGAELYDALRDRFGLTTIAAVHAALPDAAQRTAAADALVIYAATANHSYRPTEEPPMLAAQLAQPIDADATIVYTRMMLDSIFCPAEIAMLTGELSRYLDLGGKAHATLKPEEAVEAILAAQQAHGRLPLPADVAKALARRQPKLSRGKAGRTSKRKPAAGRTASTPAPKTACKKAGKGRKT